jgi:hypothetical protein
MRPKSLRVDAAWMEDGLGSLRLTPPAAEDPQAPYLSMKARRFRYPVDVSRSGA